MPASDKTLRLGPCCTRTENTPTEGSPSPSPWGESTPRAPSLRLSAPPPTAGSLQATPPERRTRRRLTQPRRQGAPGRTDPTPLGRGGGRHSRKREGGRYDEEAASGRPSPTFGFTGARNADCCHERQADVASRLRLDCTRAVSVASATYLISVCKVLTSSHLCFRKTCAPTTSVHAPGQTGPRCLLDAHRRRAARQAGPGAPAGLPLTSPNPPSTTSTSLEVILSRKET